MRRSTEIILNGAVGVFAAVVYVRAWMRQRRGEDAADGTRRLPFQIIF